MSSTPQTKQFPLAQATQALPYVARIAGDIKSLYADIIGLRREIEGLDPGTLYNLTVGEYEMAMDRLGQLVDELHAAGVQLTDFAQARVHFPATHLGRRVALVWEPGQEAITQWAELDTSAHALRPLVQLIAGFEEGGVHA